MMRGLIVAWLALTHVAASATEADFGAQARLLYVVGACGEGALPAQVDATLVARHCARLRAEVAHYRRAWLDRARPFLDRIVPSDAPRVVVYPFGGADLLTALAVYPHATELTTLSLEGVGDPRGIDDLSAGTLRANLERNRQTVNRLFREAYSTTN